MRPRRQKLKGLIAAGGEATRLEELTRVANKHLLPVGKWPMIYYPLQLLQLAGVEEVMIVTGQGHAGQLIDLLGDGRLAHRGTDDPLFDLDLTYKVQVEPGGIAQVVGMAESFVGDDRLVVCLGDNLFQHAPVEPIHGFAEGDGGALIFVKEVPDPERFGVVLYGEDGRVVDVVEKAGTVDLRYERPPTAHAVVGLYCYDATVFDIIRDLRPSARGELEITDVNRAYAEAGRLQAHAIGGWWHDAGTHEALAAIGALVEETGANQVAGS
jgi:glucose-1-phosphate thymidylyltransferase